MAQPTPPLEKCVGGGVGTNIYPCSPDNLAVTPIALAQLCIKFQQISAQPVVQLFLDKHKLKDSR